MKMVDEADEMTTSSFNLLSSAGHDVAAVGAAGRRASLPTEVVFDAVWAQRRVIFARTSDYSVRFSSPFISRSNTAFRRTSSL